MRDTRPLARRPAPRPQPWPIPGLVLGLAASLSLALPLALGTPAQAQAQAQSQEQSQDQSQAQAETASLIADSLTIQAETLLVAEGHVEIFYRGTRLLAESLRYDAVADRLTLEGPIWLIDAQGNRLLAEMAELSGDLTQGILTTARLVLADRVQMAAGQVQRSGEFGRFTTLRGVAASSCTISQGRVPLWEIRAREVVHDALARQVWFTGAQLRLAGLPVLYLPVLRVPDPTLARANGLLVPRLSSSTRLGSGLRFPYFLTLGASRDLTLTPFLTENAGNTLEFRYRQAFVSGDLTVTGALTSDRLLDLPWRGFVEAEGRFDLPRDFVLDFHLIGVSDKAYLADYDISTADRLDSSVTVSRVDRQEWLAAELTQIQTLRSDETPTTLPSTLMDMAWSRRFSPPALGGTAQIDVAAHLARREGNFAGDADGDGVADGRDLSRASAALGWDRRWLLAGGLDLGATTRLRLDAYRIDQDDAFAGAPLRLSGAAGVELRWPWMRRTPGATQMIEPVLQLVAAGANDAEVPNEDSTLIEFDEGNLFSLDRFPGADAVEQGVLANLGLGYSAQLATGLDLDLVAGRVLRLAPGPQLPDSSGLAGQASDWLIAWQMARPSGQGLSLTNRLILGEAGQLTKGELRLDLDRDRLDLAGSYAYLPADAAEDRDAAISELTLDTSYALGDSWTLGGTGQYNLDATQFTEAGLTLNFRNECLSLDLSLSRRFTSSSSLAPSTDFGLAVELLGFGGSGPRGRPGTCGR